MELLSELQSAYRAYHSTKTAVIRVLSTATFTKRSALDRGDLSALTLDLQSAAFDMHRPSHDAPSTPGNVYCIDGVVLSWFSL